MDAGGRATQEQLPRSRAKRRVRGNREQGTGNREQNIATALRATKLLMPERTIANAVRRWIACRTGSFSQVIDRVLA
jgi:hypothetical protein